METAEQKWVEFHQRMVQRYLEARDKVLRCSSQELADARADFRALHELLVEVIDATKSVLEQELVDPARAEPYNVAAQLERARKIRSGG